VREDKKFFKCCDICVDDNIRETFPTFDISKRRDNDDAAVAITNEF